MCLIVFAYRHHPDYPLVLAANRDEFYARPSASLMFWRDAPAVLAGRDLTAGGTWLGVNRYGRLAAVTNYRQVPRPAPHAPSPGGPSPGGPSRGALTSGFLTTTASAREYLHALQANADAYNGFNLLLWEPAGLFYYSNRAPAPRQLEPGIYGLSNHLLDTPWPKVERAKQALRALLELPATPTPPALLALLQDRWQPPAAQLSQTGVEATRERALAPIFIATADYGTRSSTAVLCHRSGDWRVAERDHSDGSKRDFAFRVEPTP